MNTDEMVKGAVFAAHVFIIICAIKYLTGI